MEKRSFRDSFATRCAINSVHDYVSSLAGIGSHEMPEKFFDEIAARALRSAWSAGGDAAQRVPKRRCPCLQSVGAQQESGCEPEVRGATFVFRK